jgi:small subunit ribosomal protein S16
MLAIRMQRTGRKGHAMFRVVVQDSRRTPTSGKVVAQLGTYDPHSKAVTINGEKAEFYLTNGAQPSPRAAMLLKSEGVKLPKWVTFADKKSGAIRHADKLRRNQPKEAAPVEEPAAPEAAVEPAEAEAPAEAPATEA